MMSLFNVSLSCFGGHGECFLCHPEPKTTKILLQIIGSFLDEGWLESQVLAATLLTATRAEVILFSENHLIALCTVIVVD